MAYSLFGLFAYTIQGFMHAQNIDNQNYIVVQHDRNNNAVPLQPNQGGATLDDPNKEDPGRSRTAFEMPVFAAFYSSHYPPAPTPPPTGPEPNPSPVGPFYTPTVGYYPFSETGLLNFITYRSLAADGSVQSHGVLRGSCRVNTGGYPGLRAAPVHGNFKFDEFIFGTLPTGIITIQFDNRPDHVWDYAFVQVSNDEILLESHARVPRPAVATGTMKRLIDLHYY